jgi:hypothetical protein
MSKYHGSGLIGLDVKPHRRITSWNRYRHRNPYMRWFFPMILLFLSLGIIAFADTR